MMMTCREVSDRLVEYLTGVLTDEEFAEFDAHLLFCRECARRTASMRSMLQLSRSVSRKVAEPRPEDVPESLLRAILAAGRARH